MPKFIVHVREIHVNSFEVEADDVDTAIHRVKRGFGIMVDNSTEYSHALDSSTWTVDDKSGEQVRGTVD